MTEIHLNKRQGLIEGTLKQNRRIKMEREIKFRAYHKERKEMFEIASIDFEEKKAALSNGIIKLLNVDFKQFELLQYTGLKDKNGKEIYEGDIIKYKFPYDKRIKHISPVKFLETEASFGIKDRYENEIPLYTASSNNYFEVIGNIYENKNLLEENN